jgi:hypothetical protein
MSNDQVHTMLYQYVFVLSMCILRSLNFVVTKSKEFAIKEDKLLKIRQDVRSVKTSLILRNNTTIARLNPKVKITTFTNRDGWIQIR